MNKPRIASHPPHSGKTADLEPESTPTPNSVPAAYRRSFRLSLFFNLLCVGVFAFQYYSEPDVAQSKSRVLSVQHDPESDARKPVVIRLSWRSVEHAEYPIYISNLRAIGCPEETIRDLIIADVNKLFANRYRERAGELDAPRRYWEPIDPDGIQMDPERIALRESLEIEKAVLLRNLLGIDLSTELARQEMLDSNVPALSWLREFLPPEKLDAVFQIHARFEEQRLLATGPADLDRLDALELSAVAEYLTPAELEQYQLRFSPIAEALRRELVGFEPTEYEFIELFRLKQSARAQNDGSRNVNAPSMSEGALELEEDYRRILGDDRFEALQLTRNQYYQDLLDFARNNALSEETAGQMFHLKQVAESEAARIIENELLNPEQRVRALRTIQAETERTLAETVGETNLDIYRAQFGAWMQNLAPPPEPSPLPPLPPLDQLP